LELQTNTEAVKQDEVG